MDACSTRSASLSHGASAARADSSATGLAALARKTAGFGTLSKKASCPAAIARALASRADLDASACAPSAAASKRSRF
eukprot:1774709-Alexandrium_andersonii.AAC.1